MKNYKCKRHGMTLIRIKYDFQNLEECMMRELKEKKFYLSPFSDATIFFFKQFEKLVCFSREVRAFKCVSMW